MNQIEKLQLLLEVQLHLPDLTPRHEPENRIKSARLAVLKMRKRIKKKTVYAFIDSQNLNLGTSKDIHRKKKLIYRGWKLDFRKFRKYLADKFRVKKAFLFIGYIKQNEKLYKQLRSFGYEMVFKPTVSDQLGKPKGNIDAELVLYCAAIEYRNYDKAVIVSGDGDFYCLIDFLEKRNKLKRVVIPNIKTESSLLRPFQKYKTFLIFDKDKLELKQ